MSTFDKLEIPQPVKKQSLPSTNTNTYNLTKILNKKNKSKPVTNTSYKNNERVLSQIGKRILN